MYKFIKTKNETNKFDLTNVTIEVVDSDSSLDDLVQSFGEFLAACGYSTKLLKERGLLE